MFEKITDEITGKETSYIRRLLDMATIPNDPANPDYQRYLKWVENPDAADVANLHLAEVPAIIEATQPDEADLTEGQN